MTVKLSINRVLDLITEITAFTVGGKITYVIDQDPNGHEFSFFQDGYKVFSVNIVESDGWHLTFKKFGIDTTKLYLIANMYDSRYHPEYTALL